MVTVLVSGQIAAGKSAVASAYVARIGGEVVRVRQALGEVLGIPWDDRARLQVEGAELDRRTSGMWLVDYLLERADIGAPPATVDSMRTLRQTLPVLRNLDCVLVYLDCSTTTRERRFIQAAAEGDAVKRSMTFADAMNHPTESDVLELRRVAHLLIRTDAMTVDDVIDDLIATVGGGEMNARGDLRPA